MIEAAKLEARLLTAAELALVGITRPPLKSDASPSMSSRPPPVASERRTIAPRGSRTRQAREMRGKADPRGAKPAKDNSGTVGKAQALRDALDSESRRSFKRRDAAP